MASINSRYNYSISFIDIGEIGRELYGLLLSCQTVTAISFLVHCRRTRYPTYVQTYENILLCFLAFFPALEGLHEKALR